MFADLKRLDSGLLQELGGLRQWLDEVMSDPAAADIRAVPRGSFPMINLARTDDAVRVYVFAPGLAADALEISIQDNLLTLRGERPAAPEEEARVEFRRERFTGSFSRTIALPDGLDGERAEARHRDGVFEVVLPKREELKPRRISVQAA
ncbi:Hsp20/alpha crystallin family protein [Halomonas sp. 328]|uniref:Hsp20/alpha crystallin family protein n=1 Tax=Halomonas sp. 328 TaxID=2776704 RepID=UPI0018A75D28|nr:Hsp20/alpha crystallin family protein [Halomonas sp. 328]MBF8223980.1 Hsp20/alpha crystallin family protein [Halomonas sp. 328]